MNVVPLDHRYVVVRGIEGGDGQAYLRHHGGELPVWVAHLLDASVWMQSDARDLAEQWTEYYAMKGYGCRCWVIMSPF